MANGHGGYRRPSNPASVSGPGKLSKRTDGRQQVRDLPNAEYGEGKAFREMQQGAPVAQSSNMAGPPSGEGIDLSGVVGLGEPSQSPGEPVTAGADAGEGPGADALNLPADDGTREDLIRRYGQWMPVLIRIADEPTSSQTLRDQVRYLLSMM